MTDLELGLIGNGSVGALIDGRGDIVWACLPRLDGDPVFCSLLRERNGEDSFGFLTVEITDCAPRFRQFGRMFCPMMMVRSVRPVAGSPRVRVRVRPAADYGRVRPQATWGSNHIRYVTAGAGARLQPVYRLSGKADLDESVVPSLPGYRGMGPVRVGNLAYRQVQNDVLGSAVLAATHVFFDQRLQQTGQARLFDQLETLGKLAVTAHDMPDAGLWELRGNARVHTFSSVMRWVAADRLAKIASRLGETAGAAEWRLLAEHVDVTTGELWGNFPQTYSMVGIVNSASRLSTPWQGAF